MEIMQGTNKGGSGSSRSLQLFFASLVQSTSSSVSSSGLEELKDTAESSLAEREYSSSESSDGGVGDIEDGTWGKRPKRSRIFRKRWLKQYDWYRYKGAGMFCKPSQEGRKKGPFTGTEGCTNYRTSTLSACQAPGCTT